jgi:hypothetical protein
MAKTEIKATSIKDGSIYNVDIADDAGISPSKIATDSQARFVTDTQITSWDSGNSYMHPTGFASVPASPLATNNVISQITVDASGHTTGVTTRTVSAADIGAEPTLAAGTTSQYYRGDKTWQTLPTYMHPTGFASVPASPLATNNFISQITVNASGHTTGVTTRTVSAADIGAATDTHRHTAVVAGSATTAVMTPYTPNVQSAEVIDILLPNSQAVTFLNPTWGTSPIENGRKVIFRVKQNTLGGGTITWDSQYTFAGGTLPVLTSTAGKVDALGFMYNADGAKWQLLAITKNL